MNELLGFIVLTGPLFLIVIWLPIAILLTIVVIRKLKYKNGYLKTSIGFLILIAIVIAPITDEILGGMTLNYLCATKAEKMVLRSIPLDNKLQNIDGKPIFINERGKIDWKLLSEKYKWGNRKKEPYINFLIKIDKRTSIFYEKDTGLELGKNITFSRKSGWLIRNFSPSPGGDSCWSQMFRKYNYDQTKIGKFVRDTDKYFLFRIFNLPNNGTNNL